MLLYEADWEPTTIVLALVAFVILYSVNTVIYRLCLSPIAGFPGPRLAALTYWYEVWYGLVRDGQFAFKIQDLHKRYGPIIRITPDELHISDPDFYDALYVPRYDKYSGFTNAIIAPGSLMATTRYEDHRPRRNAVNPFFSRAAIEAHVPMIKSKVVKLCRRLAQVASTQTEDGIVELHYAFSALTRDIITVMMYGKCYDSLDDPASAKVWSDGLEEGLQGTMFIRSFPMLRYLIYTIPTAWMVKMNGTMIYKLDCHSQVDRILKEERSHHVNDKPRASYKPQHTIFHQILSSGLPPSELKAPRIANEAFTLIGAGTETSAKALATIVFHLLDQPSTFARLRAELATLPAPHGNSRWGVGRTDDEIEADIPSLSTLEALPYLTAVVKEGLRCAGSVTTRTPRVAREPVHYRDPRTGKSWIIPPRTPIGMTYHDILVNPVIFPAPETFNPDRWLEADPDRGDGAVRARKDLNKYLVVFSKGSRMCLGVELVYAEMYTAVWAVAQWLELELHETSFEADVRMVRDFWTAHAKRGSRGIRVKVKGTR